MDNELSKLRAEIAIAWDKNKCLHIDIEYLTEELAAARASMNAHDKSRAKVLLELSAVIKERDELTVNMNRGTLPVALRDRVMISLGDDVQRLTRELDAALTRVERAEKDVSRWMENWTKVSEYADDMADAAIEYDNAIRDGDEYLKRDIFFKALAAYREKKKLT